MCIRDSFYPENKKGGVSSTHSSRSSHLSYDVWFISEHWMEGVWSICDCCFCFGTGSIVTLLLATVSKKQASVRELCCVCTCVFATVFLLHHDIMWHHACLSFALCRHERVYYQRVPLNDTGSKFSATEDTSSDEELLAASWLGHDWVISTCIFQSIQCIGYNSVYQLLLSVLFHLQIATQLHSAVR